MTAAPNPSPRRWLVLLAGLVLLVAVLAVVLIATVIPL
jgi:type IV secretory pathway component VirB8